MTTEKRMMPWGDVESPGGAGGPTMPFKAQVALKVGDVVSAHTVLNTVTKTVVAADATKFVGIVVGGGSDFGGAYSLEDSASVGLALVAAAKIAQVRLEGIAWCVSGGAIAIGGTVGLDTVVAGRVIANAVAGQIIGICLDVAAAAAVKVRVLIKPR